MTERELKFLIDTIEMALDNRDLDSRKYLLVVANYLRQFLNGRKE